MDRRFLGILGAIIVILAAIFIINQGSSSNTSTDTSQNSQAQPSRHIEGQGKSGVTLVEYGDFQCPICAEYYQVLDQVASQFSEQIYFQFSNLPLTQIHGNAFAAARAAEAAGVQNKYWQMHDLLYKNQSTWSNAGNAQSLFDSYARQLGLSLSKFNQDYASETVNNTINADVTAFGKTGQPMATPTFFLDGKYVDNSQFADPQTGQPSLSKFASVLNAEIAKKNPK